MAFYDTAEWKHARAQELHDAQFRCRRCGDELPWRSRETQVHHRKALKIAPALRSEPLNLMAVCRRCHRILENEERLPALVGVDGYPTDAAHPWQKKENGSA